MTEHALNSMVTDGNYIFGGEHAIMYTKVEVYCCTHVKHIISQCYFNEKEFKKKIFFFPKRNKDKSQHPKHWNTVGTNGAHSQKDPSDEADESRHCLFPQHCGMDIDSGNVEGKSHSDSMMDLFFDFNLCFFYCLHV